MNTIKCKKCNSDIPNGWSFCPKCGSLVKDNSKSNSSDKGLFTLIGIMGVVVVFIVIAIVTGLVDEHKNTASNEVLSSSAQTEKTITPTQKATETPTVKQEPSTIAPTVAELSESDFKASCAELWYDDIFFSKSNLENKNVKLNLFLEESKYFNLNAASDPDLSEMITKYGIKRDFFMCGVLRGGTTSYVGSQITVYIPNTVNASLKPGDHIVAYGTIIDYSTNSFNGYNKCYFLLKYIQ